MTRVVVQRSANASNSSQGRQSSSAPSSTTTSVPSSGNSSSSSHLPSHSSSLSFSASCPEDGVQGGKEAELVNNYGEDNVNLNNELSNKLAASTGTLEGKAHERCVQGEHSEDALLISNNGVGESLEVRREGDSVGQLTLLNTSGDFSEAVELVGVQGVEKGKELVEEGRFSNPLSEVEQQRGFASEYSAAVSSRTTDDSASERSQEDEKNGLHRAEIRLQPTSASLSLSSSSLQASGALTSPPLHVSSYSSTEISPVPESDQGRLHSFQNPPEAVGCSYHSSPAPSPPLSSSSSRRGSWLGCSGSAAPPRGSFSRRGARVGKPSRNSPNSSRPSSPRSYGEGDGYNSADEQNSRSSGSTAYENNEEREHQFEVEIRCTKNLEVRRMLEDGNCLFRAVADQVYGDAEMYDETRQMCIDYMEKERDHFSQFVTESFTAYCKRKRRDKVYGNNLEIQAMAEMYNRPIHIYSYSPEPINIFHGSYETDLPPIRLSYHRGNHYNSLIDPCRPAVGAGLGFGSLRGTNVDREQVKAALKAQQDQQIDKALLAEGRFYSDIELTEQEIQRMVMEASRAEFFEEEKHRHYASWSEETSTSAAAAPSSSGTTGSPKSTVRTMSLAATSTAAADSSGLTTSIRMLMSMGFSYLQVMEASSIFGDDVNNILCYLLETENSTSLDGESMYRKKGKAAER